MSRERIDVGDRLRAVFRDQYRDDIQNLVNAYPENRSIYLDILELHDYDPALTGELLSSPDRVLATGSRILAGINDEVDRVNLRIRNHPGLLTIGSIGVRHVDELVTIEGEVQSIDQGQARAIVGSFSCPQCETLEQRPYRNGQLLPPQYCGACESRSSFEFRPDQSTFTDIQHITLTSSDADPPISEWSLSVYLDDDLVNTLAVSTRVLVTGVVRLETVETNNRFSFYVDAISVDEELEARPDDVKDLQEIIQARWEFAINAE